jgi:hypothetical protein
MNRQHLFPLSLKLPLLPWLRNNAKNHITSNTVVFPFPLQLLKISTKTKSMINMSSITISLISYELLRGIARILSLGSAVTVASVAYESPNYGQLEQGHQP